MSSAGEMIKKDSAWISIFHSRKDKKGEAGWWQSYVESEEVAILSSDMMKCGHQLELDNSRFRVNRRRYFFALLLDLSGGFAC